MWTTSPETPAANTIQYQTTSVFSLQCLKAATWKLAELLEFLTGKVLFFPPLGSLCRRTSWNAASSLAAHFCRAVLTEIVREAATGSDSECASRGGVVVRLIDCHRLLLMLPMRVSWTCLFFRKRTGSWNSAGDATKISRIWNAECRPATDAVAATLWPCVRPRYSQCLQQRRYAIASEQQMRGRQSQQIQLMHPGVVKIQPMWPTSCI